MITAAHRLNHFYIRQGKLFNFLRTSPVLYFYSTWPEAYYEHVEDPMTTQVTQGGAEIASAAISYEWHAILMIIFSLSLPYF